MLYDSRELNTAKQAQSAVHQYGREGILQFETHKVERPTDFEIDMADGNSQFSGDLAVRHIPDPA